MANIFGLAEVRYERLFTLQGVHQNNRNARVERQFDIDKFKNGVAAVRSRFDSLSRSAGKRGAYRTTPHALSRSFMEGKGLDCSRLGPPYQHWFACFDLYNRGNPRDPNGPRRIVLVCESMADTNGYYSVSNGCSIVHVLYTNTHYGDNKKPAFQYVLPPVRKK